MSQQRDLLEQKGPHQVVHIRSDSETKLDELFNAVIHPKDHQVPLTVPMRFRNLPPSFFKQPENSKSISNNSENSTYTSTPNSGGQDPSLNSGLQINHPRAHSSPATLQQAYDNNPSQHQHLRQQSYDIVDDSPLPMGWSMAKTSAGQVYFLNHVTQTTTWEDPRKKNSTTPDNNNANNAPTSINLQNIGKLPEGWDQATTVEGEIYFINHINRTTSWLDPRIPAHLQNPPVIQTPSINAQRPPIPPQGNANPGSQQLTQSISLASAVKSMGSTISTSSVQQRQQQLRLQRLQMERERLRIRNQEIIRQTACLGNPLGNDILARQSLVEELSGATSPSNELPPTSLDSFLDGVTDFHSRQKSDDSGLGLGCNYSLPHTPEDFLSSLDDVDDCQSNDLGLDLQTSLDLGDENMDTDDLVPSLQEELNADILSDVEAILASNKDSVLTWL